MQASEFANVFVSGAEIEMIGVAENDLRVEFFEEILRDTFYRADGANGHKHWCFDDAVRESETSGAGETVSGFNCEGEGQGDDCIFIPLQH